MTCGYAAVVDLQVPALPGFTKLVFGALRGVRTESGSEPIKTNVRADPVAVAPGSDIA